MELRCKHRQRACMDDYSKWAFAFLEKTQPLKITFERSRNVNKRNFNFKDLTE
jgi:hypothetical protein